MPETTSRLTSTPLEVEGGALGQQHAGLDDDAVADHGHHVVVEDPARDELQGEGLASYDDGVTGVVAALVAHDHLDVLGEQVGQLALPLVAPLGSDHDGRGQSSLRLLAVTEPCPDALSARTGSRSVAEVVSFPGGPREPHASYGAATWSAGSCRAARSSTSRLGADRLGSARGQ